MCGNIPSSFLYCTGFIDGFLLRRGAAAVECLLADAQTAHVRGHVLAEEGEFTSAGEREFTSAEEGVPDASQRAAGDDVDDIMRQICTTAVINHGNEAMPRARCPSLARAAMRGSVDELIESKGGRWWLGRSPALAPLITDAEEQEIDAWVNQNKTPDMKFNMMEMVSTISQREKDHAEVVSDFLFCRCRGATWREEKRERRERGTRERREEKTKRRTQKREEERERGGERNRVRERRRRREEKRERREEERERRRVVTRERGNG